MCCGGRCIGAGAIDHRDETLSMIFGLTVGFITIPRMMMMMTCLGAQAALAGKKKTREGEANSREGAEAEGSSWSWLW